MALERGEIRGSHKGGRGTACMVWVGGEIHTLSEDILLVSNAFCATLKTESCTATCWLLE